MNAVDWRFEADTDGIYDLVFDDGDIATTNGLESAVLVSLFSDRRAYEDEVHNPLKRRGWIGDLVSQANNDRFGSGLWLYEQSRLTQETQIGVRNEAVQCLQWMIEEGIASNVEAEVKSIPSERKIILNVTITAIDGDISKYAYALFSATQEGILQR